MRNASIASLRPNTPATTTSFAVATTLTSTPANVTIKAARMMRRLMLKAELADDIIVLLDRCSCQSNCDKHRCCQFLSKLATNISQMERDCSSFNRRAMALLLKALIEVGDGRRVLAEHGGIAP